MEHACVAGATLDSQIRILFADDNTDLRDYVARLLGQWWSIDVAGDGAAALNAIRQHPPNLVLADVDMPGLGGMGLRQALRDDPATRSIPIVMLSERGSGAIDNLEASDCLVKPFSSRELIARVSAQLEAHVGQPGRGLRTMGALLNTIELPTAILRRDELIVEKANRAYFDIAGRDAIGKPFMDGCLEAVRTAREECARAFASGASYVTRELTLPRDRDGEREDIHWNFVFASIKDGGAALERHVAAIGVEISEEVRARDQREELAAELRRANKAKDQFLATLGHELRNPLSPILTGLQLMRAKGLSCHELDVVERQTGVIVRLVDDLLDVSRIARGQIELRKEWIDIAGLIARAIETVDPMLKERQHRLTLIVPDPGLRLCVDPQRMAQVITNLLTNAAKYSECGSEIALRAVRDGRHLRVSIDDRGIGIAPEMLPHVFESFSQARSAVRRSPGGLGLGLAIVHKLVELHGGTVTVHSDGLDAGSTFVVELPVDDEVSGRRTCTLKVSDQRRPLTEWSTLIRGLSERDL